MTQTGLKPKEYLGKLGKAYSLEGDEARAKRQQEYLRGQFVFYGLRAPEWRELFKQFREEEGMYEGKELYRFVRLCMKDPYREIHYSGLQMLQHQLETLGKENISFLEECIRTNSWWDTVDWISGMVGKHFRRFPDLQHPFCEKWINSEYMWLQRAAILHQLKYKEDTDKQLLFDLILRIAGTDEFFLQKAAGWALRQYSKTNKEAVVGFIEEYELPSLTEREGFKWLKGQGERMK